jgi:hypothetical protein
MTDEEREAAARDVVRSIQWVGSKDLVTMADRFVSPPAGESLQ